MSAELKPKRLRLTMPAPRERDIQAGILELLAMHPAIHRAWRVNSGAAEGEYIDSRGVTRKYFVRFNGQLGHSDIAGVLRGGRAFFLEVKRPGEKLTADQESFLDDMAAGGAFCACVQSVDEVVACLDQAAQAYVSWEVNSG